LSRAASPRSGKGSALSSSEHRTPGGGLLRGMTGVFVDSKLTPLAILASLLLGLFAVLFTPSEEEPQILVPMVDVMVSMPGASPAEVESRVVSPMEKLLWELPGVEYIYSTAMAGQALSVVRFEVGEDLERSLVKTYDKLYSHFDWIPPGCSRPLLRPYSIDDVPIVTLTFWADGMDGTVLRGMAAAVDDRIRSIPGVSGTSITGGLRRQVRVVLRPERLTALGIDASDVVRTLDGQNRAEWIGEVTRDNRAFSLGLDNFFASRGQVESAVVHVSRGRPIFLRQVADVLDASAEPTEYVFMGAGPGAGAKGISLDTRDLRPAVTLAVAKRRGENATTLAHAVLRQVEALKGDLIPSGVHVAVTRDYGETAKEKSDELLHHLGIATVSVAALMALLLGFRASLIVLVAIPVTLALTLFIYYITGYTLNRVTLFALIFCIGILVDDPIVGVENIIRHLQMPGKEGKPLRETIVEAVVEVGSPLILATLTVIAAILPLAFVRGLMGPYMRPMPMGATMAMFLSMVVAFVITPWTAHRILGRAAEKPGEAGAEGAANRFYRRMMGSLIDRAPLRWAFLLAMGACLVLACSLIAAKVVRVKMLPFDNKSEFQVMVNMPEGTSLEQTARVAAELGLSLADQPEVTDFQLYIGTSAPFNFNGLVRHHYLREGNNVASIQVNLLPKHMREEQSHAIVRRLRPGLRTIAEGHGGRIEVSEIPPGPPVLQTLVAEVYGPDHGQRTALAREVMRIFETTEGVVDVDWYMTAPQTEYRVVVEPDRAMALGVSPARVLDVLRTAVAGTDVGLLHSPSADEDVTVNVRWPVPERSALPDLDGLKVRTAGGGLVSLTEVARFEERKVDPPIYHKNLKPVVYVTGDVAGEVESPVYAILDMNERLEALAGPDGVPIEIYSVRQPFLGSEWAMKWDGEWHITYEVFRDMGAAFGVVLILIFILVVGWFRSYSVPLVILSPIPLSLIGIIPAHALMGAFFTATSMIGFIAGAGIVVRNSIILVDFIELRLAEGMPLAEAVVDAGTVRFRPMLLTSSAVVVGSFVILFDPIFQGLAISLMAGEVAATLFSRMVVPVLYYLDHRMKQEGRLVL